MGNLLYRTPFIGSPRRPGPSLAGHVHEKRGPTATLLPDLFALGRCFASLFAVLAADRERQRAQARLGDFLAAFETVAVNAFLETTECLVDLVQRLCLHLDQGELDIFLDVG